MKLTYLIRNLVGKMGVRSIIILIVLTVVSILAGTTWLVFLMKSEILPPETSRVQDCTSCHTEIFTGWHKGAHGDTQSENDLAQSTNCAACHKETQNISMSMPDTGSSFSNSWVKEEMPNNCLACHVTGYDEIANTWKSDGIGCETCHGVITEDHPDAVMPIDKSVENCRTCHTDDRFDWGKWEDSVHSQNSIACVDCHNPHTTSLKITGQTHGAPAQLCENCHENLAESSEHSTHTKIGVTCIDCHLGTPKGNDDFHQTPDHDFKAKIEACNECHTGQMHFAGESKITGEPRLFIRAAAGAGNDTAAQTKTRADLLPSSIGFTTVAMLFGVIGGAALRKSIYRKKR